MTADAWEAIRFMTLDELVTRTKLAGSSAMLWGKTTPEGYPFVVVVAIGAPGNEQVIEFAREYNEKMVRAGAPAAHARREPGT